MSYISLSDQEKKDMLARVGVSSVEELFQTIPEGVKLNRALSVPEAMSEPELVGHFEALAAHNLYTDYLSFLGGGVYPHFIPTVVDYLSGRGEFVSPYTPYQPEVSQGTLQVIFEFQTLICQLTGMDIANASLYDGASGAAEAVLMASRLNRRTKILVASSLHPQYRQTIDTYIRNLGITTEVLGHREDGRLDLNDLEKHLDEDVSAVIFQSPNYFGVVEDVRAVSDLMHDHHALSIAVVTEAVSLGLLEPPGALGVDIVTGEAQSLGIPLSFGGPVLGFMACRQKLIRQLPGRIAGETQDVDGNTGFVLTLSTREQHIRRERATSNICTNQALCLLRATIYLESLGRTGMR
ncbi:MAG: aminomethyl-transferring glycine dehydrogenase subunit GcvPA, partial [Candidatus Aminicenantaceae bacterium]